MSERCLDAPVTGMAARAHRLRCDVGTDNFAQTSALLLLKATLDPSGNSLQSWTPSTDPCIWSGLSCNNQGQVTSM